jgi:hypothetical protein
VIENTVVSAFAYIEGLAIARIYQPVEVVSQPFAYFLGKRVVIGSS